VTPAWLSLNLSEFGRHSGGWRHPASDVSRVPDVDSYVRNTRRAEAAGFDLVFVADTPVHARGRISNTNTRLDPLELAVALAVSTERIGIVVTVSSSYNDPYDVARRVASVDRISGGRLALNVVASTGDAVAQNFGRDLQLPHDERYAMSDEFLDVLTSLWDGDRVRHEGRWFTETRPLDVATPVHGRPLLVQAGSSDEGRNIAARWADAIYAGGSSIERAQEYYSDVKDRVLRAGRNPDDVKILLGVAPFLGRTEQEAHALHRTLDDLHLDGADTIGRLSSIFEHDLSRYDPDGPVPFDDLPQVRSASVSLSGLFRRIAREEGLSIRETARQAYAGGLQNMQWTATGTPVQVVDEMQRWWEAGTLDGFAVVAPILPMTIDDVADHVVPELRRRGIVPATPRTVEQFRGVEFPLPA
jgi:alkanesulfonate monooxygenase SsuD/methylene tetrahydromethanopterin reductase-like flavin-dependent oxidoreductase (luciferase family)